MSARWLTLLNFIGCLVLAACIVIQWRGGQALTHELHASRSREILQGNARVAAEALSKQLQGDIDGIKASIDSIQQSAAVAEEDRTLKAAEVKRLAAQLNQATEQIKVWEAAVKARDEAISLRDGKLQQLNDSLMATRKRLDEAVAELKAKGGR